MVHVQKKVEPPNHMHIKKIQVSAHRRSDATTEIITP